MKVVKSIILSVLFAGLAFAAPGDKPEKLTPPRVEAKAPTITGLYRCRGTAGKDNYKTWVEITKINDVYAVQWMNGTSGPGILDGDRFVVGYAMPTGVRVVIVYTIQPDGRLVGEWATVPTDGNKHAETLTPVPYDFAAEKDE
jgi:hypothetical protein